MMHAPIARATAPSAAIGVLTALLEARTGQQMAGYRSERIDTALLPLLRERGLDSLDQLVMQLLGGHDRQVGDQIVDALLNQETSFFRDAAVFDQIAAAVAETHVGRRRTRIWCAGCSTGQEPLSLAMTFAERAASGGAPMPEIVATDVSEAALSRARAGRYNQFEIQRGLPIRRMMRWFDEADGDWVAKPELLRSITFSRMNLVGDRPMPGRFDFILCRNVLLYLAPATKTAAFTLMARALHPGGTLVLGAGETVIGQTPLFVTNPDWRGFYTVQP